MGQRQVDGKGRMFLTVEFIKDVIDAFSLSNKNNGGKLRSSEICKAGRL